MTACTPLVLFTGAPDRVQGEHGQERTTPTSSARWPISKSGAPSCRRRTLFQRLLKRTKELSATGTEKVLEATEQAREKAKPFTDKALDTAKEAS